jgi:2-methylcitrate dehydratase PrpD
MKTGQGPTQALSQHIAQIRYDAMPANVRTVAVQCVLDWTAVTLRAVDDPLVEMLVEQVIAEGGHPQAGLVGRAHRVSARQAALVNGAASHALDYDDVNIRMCGHPTVAVFPAVLALGQRMGSSGRDVLAAFVAGYETVCLLGGMVSPGHYARGFHVTATVGAFGAAAGCAHLLRLDEERIRVALGIAATQAAGLKSMFGTMCKPLHAGKACESGMLAAELAARGFTSRNDVIECAQGFAATQTDTFEPLLPGRPEMARWNIPDNLFKYHAACYQTHAMIEAIRALQAGSGFGPADVDRIVVRQDAGANTVCNIPRPDGGLETKFSLRLLAAYAVHGLDTADIDGYTDERTRDPALVSLRDRVEVVFTPNWPITRSEVTVKLKDGRELFAEHDSGVPDTDLRRQTDRLTSKLQSLVGTRLGPDRTRRITDAALGFEALPNVAGFVEALAPTAR